MYVKLMKRKTNLFYTSGPDSKFITFSNYTEALTGNYLSVNTKLFPDNFLCLNIKNLNRTTKPLFIKYLVKYYENKLAAIRDNNISNNETIEHHIYPLSYLLEAILKVVTLEDGEYALNVNENNTSLNINESFDNEDVTNLITYIGQISETDYYGTYTDIICNIDCENYNEGIIKFDNTDMTNKETVTLEETGLYGWENDEIIGGYENEAAIYDEPNTYVCNSLLERLTYHKIDKNSESSGKTLKFNVIIPLFSMLNINKDVDIYNNRIKNDSELRPYIVLNNEENKHVFDVPLGMWIYADKEEDDFIKLEKDETINLYPNWSLLISSQFKPFPYSTKIEKENATSNNNESGSIMNSFSTFAEVLSKMNDVLDNFNEINKNIINLNNRLDKIESSLNNIGTEENIQSLNEKIVEINSNVDNKIDEFKNHMYGYLNNLKWSAS